MNWPQICFNRRCFYSFRFSWPVQEGQVSFSYHLASVVVTFDKHGRHRYTIKLDVKCKFLVFSWKTLQSMKSDKGTGSTFCPFTLTLIFLKLFIIVLKRRIRSLLRAISLTIVLTLRFLTFFALLIIIVILRNFPLVLLTDYFLSQRSRVV